MKYASSILFFNIVMSSSSLFSYTIPDGTLDPFFGGWPISCKCGVVITPVSDDSHDIATGIALTSEGKLVVAGNSGNNFCLVRYNTNGNLDDTFNETGIAVTDLKGNYVANALTIQADDKIVIAGQISVGFCNKFALVRFNQDGLLDPDFGQGGIASLDLGGIDIAYALLEQPDGKLVVVGKTVIGFITQMVIARYNSDGSLDTSFNQTGIMRVEIDGFIAGTSVALQLDGKLVVAAEHMSLNSLNTNIALIRLNSDGSLDSSFNQSGMVITTLGSIGNRVKTVVVQPDGKLVVAGGIDTNLENAFLIVRYNEDGTLDSGFGQGGMIVTSVGSFDLFLSLALQPDGKIIAGGFTKDSEDKYRFAIARYIQDGTLDNEFGVNGLVTTRLFERDSIAKDIVLQQDGKVAVAGVVFNPVTGYYDFAVARYLAFNGEF